MVLATTLAGLVAMQGLHAAPLLKREGVVRFLNIYFKHKMNLGPSNPVLVSMARLRITLTLQIRCPDLR